MTSPTTMKQLIAVLLLVPGVALAQDIGLYNRALSAFNSGDYDAAAQTFYEISENSTDPDLRTKSEYYLAQSFAKKNLPVTSFIYYAAILRAGQAHHYYLKA